MAKLLLLSVVISMITLPVLAARDPNPRRGLKKTLFGWVAFNLVYMLAVRFLYVRLA